MGPAETTTSLADVQDTDHLTFKVGERVLCTFGALKGVEGEIAALRTGGRLLVKVANGLYVELPRICAERK